MQCNKCSFFFLFFLFEGFPNPLQIFRTLSSHSKNAIIILLPANILHFNPHSRIFERRRASISFNWNWSWLNRFIVWQRLAGRFWCSHNITRDWITESALPCEWIAAILKIVCSNFPLTIWWKISFIGCRLFYINYYWIKMLLLFSWVSRCLIFNFFCVCKSSSIPQLPIPAK